MGWHVENHGSRRTGGVEDTLSCFSTIDVEACWTIPIVFRGHLAPVENILMNQDLSIYKDLSTHHMAVCQNLVPLVNIKIAGKWMFIPLKMVLIGIDPYPYPLGLQKMGMTSIAQRRSKAQQISLGDEARLEGDGIGRCAHHQPHGLARPQRLSTYSRSACT